MISFLYNLTLRPHLTLRAPEAGSLKGRGERGDMFNINTEKTNDRYFNS